VKEGLWSAACWRETSGGEVIDTREGDATARSAMTPAIIFRSSIDRPSRTPVDQAPLSTSLLM
jgi:hypothetical protein